MKKIIIFLIGILILGSCNTDKKSNYVQKQEVIEDVKDTLLTHPGKIIMQTKCYVCHNPSANHDLLIAPPMVAVKSHYFNENITKKEFTNAIWEFVKKPSEEKSKMKGAVNRFGIMPYQSFSEEEIKLIAEYMYEYKIDEPKWFKKHIEEESRGKMKYFNGGKVESKMNSSKIKTSKEIGLEYVNKTKKELGKNLMGTIQKKGTLEAIKFCNKKAYPITDSMAVVQNAVIKRVSDKPRNKENKANLKELKIIDTFKKLIIHTGEYEPIVEEINSEVQFYYPIITNSMCLQCHGTPNKDIEPDAMQIIKQLYPEDKAIGYDVNEVRGIWSISYKN
ncbi:Tll0287-like domain-containing protein [Urechidicola croceus]|uniref:Cytochrome c family protein n=1 Tax=Urechidicola croceus TaxID=1850246 RepID=A0A1D8P6G9_9FLAO|nr:DUF3365 domain-containing protein [Urechidicola croceus]AOW20127.1 cytochrome c family protein [Urechidicola croceus]